MFKHLHVSFLHVEISPLHIQGTDNLAKKEFNQIYGLEAFLLSYSIKKISADYRT
jgi:hypothetical protein